MASYSITLRKDGRSATKSNVQVGYELLFRPNDLSGLALWLDGVSITESEGVTIKGWKDKSGNNRNAIPTGSPKVEYLNNLPTSLASDGDYYTIPRITNARSIFIVAKKTGPLHPGGEFILGDSSTNDFHPPNDDNRVKNKLDNLFVDIDVPWLAGGIKNGKVFKNGLREDYRKIKKPMNKLELIEVLSTEDLITNSISKDRSEPNRNWRGNYAEVIIYGRVLPKNERLQVENYLMNKWNL